MKTFWTSVAAVTFAATVGLSAQDPQAPGSRGAAPGGQAAAKKVTVTGCIQSAPPAAPGQQASASKFVLATKPSPGGAPGGAVGTAGSVMRYQLQGQDKEISTHLNQQVEITGMVEGSPEAAAKGAGPTLRVESVKMVSATCN